jgi:hypothetical protein
MAIDQVVNGDIAMDMRGNLAKQFVKVERVVDIVQNLFKMSSAMSLLEDTHLLEVPYPQLQAVMSSCMMNVKIEY